MEYDIVLITRNRPDVLRISIPLMLAQSRVPRNFIVVDASDDHESVRQVIENLWTRETPPRLSILHDEPGTSRQRNVGLRCVSSPVVIFPDDDSLWFPGTAEAMMRIYERDGDRTIGAVCAAEAPQPPWEKSFSQPYRLAGTEKLKRLYLKYLRSRMLLAFPDPLYFHCDAVRAPEWLAEEKAVVQGPMAGFRMSFRADLIKEIGFDESLGRYALSEDIEASLAILKTHLIVRAENARVYHYSYPSKRIKGKGMGMMQMLNRAYIVCKYNGPEAPARKFLWRFLIFRLIGYLSQFFNHYGRDKFRGSLRALRYVNRIRNAAPAELQATYRRLRDECAGRLGLDRDSS